MASDTSSLSDVPPSEDEKPVQPSKPFLKLVNGKLGGFSLKKATPASSPEPDQADLGRDPSPPHEYVLADNSDISLVVLYAATQFHDAQRRELIVDRFRLRFDAAFPKNVPDLGPQDVENGVVSTDPSEGVENMLCALLGLALNRKKNPERGHYARALEECLSTYKTQWPRSWAGKNPIAGGKTFQAFSPSEKLDLLRTLIHWSLAGSESINTIIKESYKQTRKDDDINQPLSIQPWGLDTRKRKFYLAEGQVDAPFRIYRESERKASSYAWINVAGTIEQAQNVARDLRAEKSQAAHRLATRITNAIPMFEEREEKRRRRGYRKMQKERFTRPEPGFSLYEGRTRGKRMRYTYDDEDIYGTDENRRSSRNSRTATPADGPTFTASGRQVRSAFGRSYGDSSRQEADSSAGESSHRLERDGGMNGRGYRAARRDPGVLRHKYSNLARHVADFDDESDAESSAEEWGGDDQDFESRLDDEDEGSDADADASSAVSSEDELSLHAKPRSLIVNLRCGQRLAQVLHERANGVANISSQFKLDALDSSHLGKGSVLTNLPRPPPAPPENPSHPQRTSIPSPVDMSSLPSHVEAGPTGAAGNSLMNMAQPMSYVQSNGNSSGPLATGCRVGAPIKVAEHNGTQTPVSNGIIKLVAEESLGETQQQQQQFSNPLNSLT